MPPKGWRKNSEGQYSSSVKGKEEMSIDDLLFPRSTVLKLAKSILNEEEDQGKGSNMILAKDSSIALQRSATVFVSYVLFHARHAAKEANRKTVNAQDIVSALESSELNGFVPEVKQKLSVYEEILASKKQRKEEAQSRVEEGDPILDEDSNQNKRLKDNELNTVKKSAGDVDDSNDADDTEDRTVEEENTKENGDSEQDTDGEEDAEADENADETADVNPIAALDEEDKELRGAEVEVEEDEEEKEASSDEES